MTGAEVGALLVLFGVAPIGSWVAVSCLVAVIIRADPARMPRIAAWISGQVWHPLADNPMTLTTVTRLGWGALYFIVILMMQGVDVRAFADPNQSATWADVKIAVVLVEAALLIWTVWLVATFWRARSRSR